MRIPASTRRDFDAYVYFRRLVGDDVLPRPVVLVPVDDAVPAIERFYWIESRGEYGGCDDPGLLKSALEGKAQLNLHITDIWPFGVRDASAVSAAVAWDVMSELRREFCELPEWVWHNLWRQAMRGHEFESLNRYDDMKRMCFVVDMPGWRGQ